MLITCRHIKQKLYGNSFFPPAVVLWNNTPLGIRKSLSLKKFKTRLNKSESNVPFYCYEGDRRQNIQHCRLCLRIDHIFSRFVARQREREMFYLMTHSTHFIYGYMVSDIWLRTILIVRKETRCRHIGYSYRLTARVLLYAPSHGFYCTSHGALAGARNSSMGAL